MTAQPSHGLYLLGGPALRDATISQLISLDAKAAYAHIVANSNLKTDATNINIDDIAIDLDISPMRVFEILDELVEVRLLTSEPPKVPPTPDVSPIERAHNLSCQSLKQNGFAMEHYLVLNHWILVHEEGDGTIPAPRTHNVVYLVGLIHQYGERAVESGLTWMGDEGKKGMTTLKDWLAANAKKDSKPAKTVTITIEPPKNS